MPTFLLIVLVMGFMVLLVTGALSLVRELTTRWYRPTVSTTAGADEVTPYRRQEFEPPPPADSTESRGPGPN